MHNYYISRYFSSYRSNQDISLLVDALAACLFSSKLESVYRYWALKQLLKVFSQVCDKKSIKNATANKSMIHIIIIIVNKDS